MNRYLAQVNIAKLIEPMDSPRMAEFVNNLDRINALAENSPGFIWRLKDDTNNATSLKIFNDDSLIINMSVWRSMDDLFAYVYKSDHVEIYKKRKEWFAPMKEMHMAMWYVDENHYPDIKEAEERLIHIRVNGPTSYAFNFKKRF